MTVVLDKITASGNRGSHFNKGGEFLYYVNEFTRDIFRQPINPATMLVQQASRALTSGALLNLNGQLANDLRWVGGTTKQVSAQGNARIFKLSGVTSLDQISPDALVGVAWAGLPNNQSLSEDGLSAVGNFYALRIPAGTEFHYAKVRIFFQDGGTKIEWVTYLVGTKPLTLHTLSTDFPAPRDIVVSAFDSELLVSGGEANGYVIKIPRLVSGSFPQYSNFPTPVHSTEASLLLDNPQQLALDGSSIFVVANGRNPEGEVVTGGLFLLQPENSVQVQVVSGIANPVGLLLDTQGATTIAYISNSDGEIYAVNISAYDPPLFSDGFMVRGPGEVIEATTSKFSLNGPSGFLTWADEAHSAFYAPLVDDPGKVKRIDIGASSISDETTSTDPVLPSPWSIEVFTDSSMSAICDAGIYDLERGIIVTGDLALGLGLIPFQFINKSVENPPAPAANDGKANTSSAPGYYFSNNPNLAFGGSVSLLINHQAAWNANLRFYKVSILKPGETVQNKPITNGYVDLRWNSLLTPPRFESVTTGVQSGAFYPIRNPADLWFNPFLAAILNTNTDDNGHRQLQIDFFNANKLPVAGASFTRLVYFDNTKSQVGLMHLRRGTTTIPPAAGAYQVPDTCGVSPYDSKDDLVEFDLTAVHPLGIGTYALAFFRGSTHLFTATGNLTSTAQILTVKERSPGVPLKIGHLTGNCDIANITVQLSTPSPGVINGYGWVNLGMTTTKSFTLAKPVVALHTHWQEGPAAPQPREPKESRKTLAIGPAGSKK